MTTPAVGCIFLHVSQWQSLSLQMELTILLEWEKCCIISIVVSVSISRKMVNPIKDTLQDSLASISEKGSKDDISISGIYDLKELVRFKEIMKKMHECGKLRIRLNYLTDTSGGVSDYSLEAAKKSWDRAQTEQLQSEKELNRLKQELKTIHDALLSMQMEAIRKGTHYHDPHKIADELQHYHRKEQSLRYELQKTSDTIHSLEQKAKRYQDQNQQEQISIQREASLIEKVRQLEEDVKIKEQRYYELKAKREQSDEEMQQLLEEISIQETEIQSMIRSLSSNLPIKPLLKNIQIPPWKKRKAFLKIIQTVWKGRIQYE